MSASVRLSVTGATGRMGREVIAAAGDREGCSVVLAVNRDPSVEEVDGVPVRPAADLVDGFRTERPDALVDFTGPESCVEYAVRCGEAGVPFISGTTGLSEDQRESVRTVANRVPLLVASNFSRGIAVLERLAREAAAGLPRYDVELVETHHNGKRDAPSGTAEDLLDAIDDAHDREYDRVHGREGESLRSEGEVGVHSLRAGDVTGEHTVVLAGDGEQVQIQHRAGTRRAFASGAVDAAIALAGRDPGLYELSEVQP
jgi:4-hydroxy-tetrahydrodipicolinate reductase